MNERMMTPNQAQQKKRFMIAEACGWKRHEVERRGFSGRPVIESGWVTPYGAFVRQTNNLPPNYPSDLNGMHEAVSTLNDEELRSFAVALGCIVVGQSFDEWDSNHWPAVLKATPEQWCDAFIEVKGLK